MKPKRIRITKPNGKYLTEGKIYDVVEWESDLPEILGDDGEEVILTQTKWEPVQEFNHGDPVWAWDFSELDKCEGIYLCDSVIEKTHNHVIERKDEDECSWVEQFKHVKHRKPTITLKELAEKAGVDLNEYELDLEA